MSNSPQEQIQAPMTTDEQRDVILNVVMDFFPDDIGEYIRHVGFDIQGIGDPKNFVDAWLGHYRLGQGTYDVDRALMDFTTWPPISRRIFELQDEARKLAT